MRTAKIRDSAGKRSRSARNSGTAPCGSWMFAGCACAASTNPCVSVTIWRLRPLMRWPASTPRGPPLSVIATLWLSMMPTEGIGPRPARRRAGRGPIPSVGIIDSQSVATTESGGPRGVDAGKRIKGRKRHIVTDTQGFVLAAQVHPANIQDPHGAVPLLRALRDRFPELAHIFADRIYRGAQLREAVADCGPWTIQIIE